MHSEISKNPCWFTLEAYSFDSSCIRVTIKRQLSLEKTGRCYFDTFQSVQGIGNFIIDGLLSQRRSYSNDCRINKSSDSMWKCVLNKCTYNSITDSASFLFKKINFSYFLNKSSLLRLLISGTVWPNADSTQPPFISVKLVQDSNQITHRCKTRVIPHFKWVEIVFL